MVRPCLRVRYPVPPPSVRPAIVGDQIERGAVGDMLSIADEGNALRIPRERPKCLSANGRSVVDDFQHLISPVARHVARSDAFAYLQAATIARGFGVYIAPCGPSCLPRSCTWINWRQARNGTPVYTPRTLLRCSFLSITPENSRADSTALQGRVRGMSTHSPNWSSNALASFRSDKSWPSVNQA